MGDDIMSEPYGSSAREYWRQGWRNPLPVQGKNFPPEGYTGIDGHDVSWPDLEAWIETRFNRNVGLRSQGSWVGIDVDAYGGKVGDRTLAEYEARLGKLPPTITSTSRGKDQPSRIYFFSIPPGTKINPEGAMRDIEIIRREHRYAIVHPSIHPRTGETYYWYGDDGEQIDIPALSDMAPFPAAWLAELTQARPTSPVAPSGPAMPFGQPARAFTPEQADTWRTEHLSRIRSASRGQVNAAFGGAARALYRFVPEFWSRGEIESGLMAALADVDIAHGTSDPAEWSWSADSQLSTAWLASRGDWTASRAFGRPAMRDPTPDDAPLGFSPLSVVSGSAASSSIPDLPRVEPAITDGSDESGLIVWSEFFSADLTKVDWLAGRFLQVGRQAALVGDAKSGKSLLSLEWACAIASGKPFAGDESRTPRKVLYVDQENSRADIQMRLRALGYGPGDLDNLIYLSFPPFAPLDTQHGATELLTAVAKHETSVVFLDTISRMIEGEENDSRPWLAFYRLALKPLKSAGISAIRLDHLGKDQSKGARGNSAKTGDVDEVWELRRGESRSMVLERTHTRTGIGTDVWAIERTGRPGEIGTTKHLASPMSDDVAPEIAREISPQVPGVAPIHGERFSADLATLVSVMTDLFSHGGGKGEIRSVCTSRSAGKRLSAEKFQRAWNEALELGWLYSTGRGFRLHDTETRAKIRADRLATEKGPESE
jgi:hypothetical protein